MHIGRSLAARGAMAALAASMLLPASTAAAVHRPASGHDTVSVAIGSDALSLIPDTIVDATTNWQLQQIYDPLLGLDGKTEAVIPWLATSWKATSPTTWTLTLRHGVRFQDGEPFDASAVQFTMSYIQNPANKSAVAAYFSAVKSVTAPNPYTVVFHLSQFVPFFPYLLATEFLVMPPKYIQQHGLKYFASHPVGTGPYEFVSQTLGQNLVLKANPHYWRGKPAIQNVVFDVIPDFSARLSAFLAGKIDIIEELPYTDIPVVQHATGARVVLEPSARFDYIALVNLKPGPLDNVKVRQALNYAVNVPLLIRDVMDGHAIRDPGALPRTNSGFDPAIRPYTYNPALAKKLIQEAGYKPQDLNLTFSCSNGRYPMDSEVCQAVAAELGQIGIHVHVISDAWAVHLTKIINRTAGDMFYLGWGPSLYPQDTLGYLFEGNQTYSGFNDPALTALITKAETATSLAAQKADWNAVQVKIQQLAPWIFLWQQDDVYGVVKWLDWQPRPDEEIDLFDAHPVG
jgi:peptide/nickel transport system substrate-binding protein